MAHVTQISLAEGDLLYCTSDGEEELMEHHIGNPNWVLKSDDFSDHDLFDCRLALMNGLKKIEDEMESRNLIGRIT